MTERLPCCLEWVVATAPRCRDRFCLLFSHHLSFFCVYLLVFIATSCVTISAYSARLLAPRCRDSRGGYGRVSRGSIPTTLPLPFPSLPLRTFPWRLNSRHEVSLQLVAPWGFRTPAALNLSLSYYFVYGACCCYLLYCAPGLRNPWWCL
ncbi:hypothetical protein BJV77DRAFT_101236 [Russula vinacea]|nr:hypothetical protein BJV77DRAFT_101236 [Russula vinacea]